MNVIKMEREIYPLAIGRSNTTDIEEENSLFQERNLLDVHMSGVKEEDINQSHDLITEMKFEEDPMAISFSVMKREPEERNFLDHHLTGIKEEHEDQSSDLLSEIKFEGDPVPISFPMVKREPEEEESDLDTVNDDARVEVSAEDNEVLTER
ncbi:uncharacterized protein [Periplaneta americana]|uniref:uncharacterized protein n=1 Tax=Periplaneta americana TaxID=6978 RepID=UPI0037E93072